MTVPCNKGPSAPKSPDVNDLHRAGLLPADLRQGTKPIATPGRKALDDNDLHRAGMLSDDPFVGTGPAPSAYTKPNKLPDEADTFRAGEMSEDPFADAGPQKNPLGSTSSARQRGDGRGGAPLKRESKSERRRRELPPGARVFERGDQSEITSALLEAIGPDPLTFDAGEFYRYSPALGIWEQLPDYLVRSTVEQFAGCPVEPRLEPLKIGAATTIGVETMAKDRLRSIPGRVTFAKAPSGIAFANGFVTVKNSKIELRPHDPEHRARFAYPFDYQPDALSPKLDLFLEQLFADVDKFERDLRIMLLQEFIGTCLIGESVRNQRYLVLFATGGNGKSELLTIVRGIFPPDSIASLPPHKWGDRFLTIMLEGKRANIVDELPDGEIMAGEAVKQNITGGLITADRKNRDAVQFIPTAGHILACNSEIRSADPTEGFWRRPIIVPLTRNFEGSPDRVLEAGQAVLDAERAAVVTWALFGAARVQAQKGYTTPPSSGALLRSWRDESDQIRTFLSERMLAPGETQATTAYEIYKDWAKESGHGPMSRTMFGRRMVATKIVTRKEVGDFRYYVREAAGGA